jgi:hypothetical protein
MATRIVASAAAPAAATQRTESILDLSRSRVTTTTGSWSVHDIVSQYNPPDEKTDTGNDGIISLPLGQRLWAWKDKRGQDKQTRLIDSVMYNFPIPTLILSEHRSAGSLRYKIQDGRHRVETMWRFKNNKFSWNATYYRDLCPRDQQRFDERMIPVVIIKNATIEQLADIFIRLNNGMALKDKDYFWAHREKPLIKRVREIVAANAERFKPLFGGVDLTNRDYLPDWIAIIIGLSTWNAGNMTTSYIRVSEGFVTEPDGSATNFLDMEIEEERVEAGLNALFNLYTAANERNRALPKTLKRYRKVGFVTAFYLAEWMEVDDAGEAALQAKWVGIIDRIRTDPKNEVYLRTTGAQNLTTKKISDVLKQVNDWLRNAPGTAPPPDGSSDDGEEDDE